MLSKINSYIHVKSLDVGMYRWQKLGYQIEKGF